jgi:ribosomal protein S18 acetylase RimI-like enzyme
MTYRIEPLGKHDRKHFSCGAAELERYFREQVTQDIKRRLAYCFVAVGEDNSVAGFYTLAATSIALDRLSPDRVKYLPRYPVVPAVLLGRLAVATAHQGKRLGGALVVDALLRSARSEIVGHLMVVDAKDETAASFYEHLGFERLPDDHRRLIRRL